MELIMPRDNKQVQVQDVLIAVETQKAYGIIPLFVIMGRIDARAISNYKELRDGLDGELVWVPKSLMGNVRIEPHDIFPMMPQGYPSKFNAEIILYKSKITFTFPEGLATEKKLPVADAAGGQTQQPVQPQQPTNQPANEPTNQPPSNSAPPDDNWGI